MRSLSLLLAALLSLLGSPPQEPTGVAQGAVVRPAVALTGRDSAVERGSFHRVQEPQELARLWLLHRGLAAPKGDHDFFYNDAGVPEVDFAGYEVLVLFGGATVNSAGFHVESIADDAQRRVVRYDHKHFQTEGPDGGGKTTRPFAFFVLPRTKLPIVLEEDVQGMSGQPPVWKEQARL